MNKEITIGIPFYSETNQLQLETAVNSIVNQTIEPKLIHLIQDGPVNKSLKKLVEDYDKKYPNIKILELPKKGLPYALNQSIELANTKYYARMDSDDISFNSRLEKQIKFLEENPSIDILGTWAIEFENNILEKGFINKKPDSEKKIFEYFHYMNPLIHPSVVFRMSVFGKIGLYNEKFYTAQDLELWSRALKNKIKISNIQEPLLYYRVDGRNKRRSSFPAILRQIKARYALKTFSIKLNILKLSSIILRLLPGRIKDWAYKNLRN
tara:strand:+ start:434 stop:1234 length:801 start_codon:yes stop_codon:yes gene_type:complete